MADAPLNWAALLSRQAEVQLRGGLRRPMPDEVAAAYLAEVGELANAAKRDWAWWTKPGDRPTRREDVLAEAADVLHIWLIDANHRRRAMRGELSPHPRYAREPLATLLARLGRGMTSHTPEVLCAVVALYGYAPADLAAAYWQKSEVNLRRWGAA